MLSEQLKERLVNDSDSLTDVELEIALNEAEKQSEELVHYGIAVPATHPYWFECHAVEHKGTEEFLGFVGRLGMSKTWEYDDLLPGSKGKGRTKSMEGAIYALAKAAGVDI